MISDIKIENFRSIRSSAVKLSPLTILIGANGSGKSNLVKAIEFIAAIPAAGFSLALSRQGGRDGIMPKQISASDLGNYETKISYTKRLPAPGKVHEDISYVNVSHSFTFSFKGIRKVLISEENLKFNKVLYIGETLRHKNLSPDIDKDSCAHPKKNSYFALKHLSGKDSYETYPPISEETFANFRTWLGLDRFKSAIKNHEDLEKFLNVTQKTQKREKSHTATAGPKANRTLYTERNARSICDFSTEFQLFLDCLEDTKRYDLLLNELRREQTPSESPDLSKAGENLPAALRRLTANKEAYARLKSTFESIAPHILSMRPKQLRTGSEFIEFTESKSGRGIESWETSDGSLRALAILVAVETANLGDSIVVEEPEQNLHPWAIRALIDHIREVIEKKSIQVIITTHSEHVLERAAPEEVLIASRSQEFGTSYQKVSDLVDTNKVAMGDIGRLWVKGMLGGVPSL